MEAVNKKVIAETVAEKHNLTKKESAEIVDLVFDTVAEALKDGAKVDIAGFGKFEVKTVKTGIKFNLKAGNGEVIATSEIYTTEAACRKGIDSVVKNAAVAAVDV